MQDALQRHPAQDGCTGVPALVFFKPRLQTPTSGPRNADTASKKVSASCGHFFGPWPVHSVPAAVSLCLQILHSCSYCMQHNRSSILSQWTWNSCVGSFLMCCMQVDQSLIMSSFAVYICAHVATLSLCSDACLHSRQVCILARKFQRLTSCLCLQCDSELDITPVMPISPIGSIRQDSMADILRTLDGAEADGAMSVIKKDPSMTAVSGETETDFDALAPTAIQELDEYLGRNRPEDDNGEY